MTEPIKLPPLPKGFHPTQDHGECFDSEDIQAYARAAIEADRQGRGEQVASRWIDPNDKTQKQYLPNISERVLFKHDGHVYTGWHTGGSFKSEYPLGKHFCTWDCLWMYPESIDTPQSQQIPEGYRLQPISEFDAMMNTRTIPEGYRLVPIEPTDEMIDAAYLLPDDKLGQHYFVYKAMLEAAPEPKEQK